MSLKTLTPGVGLRVNRTGLMRARRIGDNTAAPPPANPPANTLLPALSFTAPLTVGTIVSCSTGNWSNSPTDYAYEWSVGGVVAQSGASNTYTVVSGDVGKTIVCKVTATNVAGFGEASTNASSAVIPPPPVNSVLPVINYVAPINWGQTLICSTGTWSNSPTTYIYRWLVNGVQVQTGSSNQYTVGPTDVSKTIACEVTASNAAGSGSPATSTLTPQVVNFQPNDLSGLVLFFQPYNPASVVLVDGKVSQLTNAAPGNTNHLTQVTAASQPSILSADLNGKDVLYAASNGPWLENLAVTGLSASAYSSFCIATMNAGGNTSGRAFTLAPASATDGSGGSFIPFIKAATNDSYNTQAGTSNLHPTTLATWHGIFATRDATVLNSWLDGGDPRTNTPTSALSALTRMAMWANFTASAVGTTRGNGKTFCALLWNRVLTTLERQKVEGWGMWLAGLQSLLPSDHPYKNAAP